MSSTEATRAMPPQRRRIEPIAPEQRRRREAAPPPERRRRRGRGKLLFGLLLLALLAAAIVYGALELQNLAGDPRIREVGGDLQQTVEDLRDHIRDNTR